MAGMMGTPNPEDLLMQIRALLDEYLALGPDTPVAQEAQQLSEAIDATAGGQGPADAGAPPPENPAAPDMGAEPVVPPENQMGGNEADLAMEEPPPNKGAKTYAEANVSAAERLKRRNSRQ